jgi:hypothetical protein
MAESPSHRCKITSYDYDLRQTPSAQFRTICSCRGHERKSSRSPAQSDRIGPLHSYLVEESAAGTGTAAGTATAAAAMAGLGLGVGGWSSPSLSGGSTLRSASIIALGGGGGGWASGIVSVRVSGKRGGGFVSSGTGCAAG